MPRRPKPPPALLRLIAANEHPPLGRADALRVAALATNGDPDARNVLVCSNLRFVLRLVLDFAVTHPGIDLSDAFQEGILGLMRAIDLWSPSRAAEARSSFHTYAASHVHAYVQRYWLRQLAAAHIRPQSAFRAPRTPAA